MKIFGFLASRASLVWQRLWTREVWRTFLGHRMAKDIERTHVDHLGRSKMSPWNGFGEIDFS